MMMRMLVFCTPLIHLCALVFAAKTVVTAPHDLAVLNATYDSVSLILVAFLGLLRGMQVYDAMLFDIPLHQEILPQQYSRPMNLRLADINDVLAFKMTHFNHNQLRQLYSHIGFAGMAVEMLDNTIQIFTGQEN